jgi:divalent metal cation (Fe/Co/Zn/Cd) transporter
VLAAQKAAAVAGTAATAAAAAVQIPTWPALLLAAISIASKEWLYRITKRVGEAMNSQILIANAWHHRSDAFSSVLSLLSIAAAIMLPGFLILDSAAGMFVAGMICLTGLEVMFESVKQLTDTSDKRLAERITTAAGAVEGVVGIKQVRARTIGSGSLVDLTILTDMKISATAANAIGQQTRWKIMESFPQVMDVMVHTQATQTVCPLLSATQRSVTQVEKEIRQVLSTHDDVKEVKRVTVHYVDSALLYTEVVIKVDPELSVRDSQAMARRLQQSIVKGADIYHADIHLDISSDDIESFSVIPTKKGSDLSFALSKGALAATGTKQGVGYGLSARISKQNKLSPSLEVHAFNREVLKVERLVDAVKQGIGYGLSARVTKPGFASSSVIA